MCRPYTDVDAVMLLDLSLPIHFELYRFVSFAQPIKPWYPSVRLVIEHIHKHVQRPDSVFDFWKGEENELQEDADRLAKAQQSERRRRERAAAKAKPVAKPKAKPKADNRPRRPPPRAAPRSAALHALAIEWSRLESEAAENLDGADMADVSVADESGFWASLGDEGTNKEEEQELDHIDDEDIPLFQSHDELDAELFGVDGDDCGVFEEHSAKQPGSDPSDLSALFADDEACLIGGERDVHDPVFEMGDDKSVGSSCFERDSDSGSEQSPSSSSSAKPSPKKRARSNVKAKGSEEVRLGKPIKDLSGDQPFGCYLKKYWPVNAPCAFWQATLPFDWVDDACPPRHTKSLRVHEDLRTEEEAIAELQTWLECFGE